MEQKLSYFRKKGDSYVFAASMGLILSLAMVFWIIYIILLKGLSFFWPRDLVQVQLENGSAYLGELWEEKKTVQTGADGKQIGGVLQNRIRLPFHRQAGIVPEIEGRAQPQPGEVQINFFLKTGKLKIASLVHRQG